jgi:ubiquinone/menaquinone biosynthesis C-methylase UbiE
MLEFDATLIEGLESSRAAASAELKAERYLAMLQAQPGERILDVGCGGGWLSRRLAPLAQPAGQVVAIDSSSEAIDLALSRSGEFSCSALRYQCAHASALPFAADEFDAAVCVSMLGFCEDPAQAVAEIRRVLCPGGRLVVANSDEDTRIYNVRDRERGRRIERAIADRTRDPWMGRRLAHLLMQAGFRVVRETVACDVEHRFAPGCAGYTLAHTLRGYLVTHGGIELEEYEHWLTDLREADWAGAYTYAVTTFAYLSVIGADQGAHHGA